MNCIILFFFWGLDYDGFSPDIGLTLHADENLPVVTPSSIDPALLKRYNELYDAVIRARKDKKKKYDIFCFLPVNNI